MQRTNIRRRILPRYFGLAWFEEAAVALRDWALSFDIAAEVERHAEIREPMGLGSLDHITALATLGRHDVLCEHRLKVEQGTSILHPLVSAEQISRAIELVEGS